MACPALLPTLVDALLLDPAHARAAMAEPLRAAVQRDAADCLLQLALFGPGRALLARDADG